MSEPNDKAFFAACHLKEESRQLHSDDRDREPFRRRSRGADPRDRDTRDLAVNSRAQAGSCQGVMHGSGGWPTRGAGHHDRA